VNVKLKTSKSDSIRQSLLNQLKAGDYARGGRLPPERALAGQLGVSYMTVRKVINGLVDDGYLTRRVGQGTFVRRDVSEEHILKQIGFLCPAWMSPEAISPAMHLFRIAEANNWQPRLFNYRSFTESLVSDVLSRCDGLVVLPMVQRLTGEMEAIFRASGKPAVFIGVPMYVMGFDSVMGEPEREIDMAIDHLHHLGHTKIGYTYQEIGTADVSAENRALSRWKQRVTELCPDVPVEQLIISVKVPLFEWPHQVIYQRIVDLFHQKHSLPFTAMVCPMSWVMAVMAALHDLKIRVPQDISVVAIGDRDEMRFSRPKLTTVLVSEEEHITQAWNLIQKRLSCPDRPAAHATINPKLIVGDTTASLIKGEK